jgi:UDP-2,3-diacylglucosamine hydrolase
LTKENIYFASDFHLGSPNLEESHKREKLIVSWLTSIEKDAKAIYLVGDIFDFWFEYKKVIPKGFVRLLGKLAELTDKEIAVHLFVGNHDLWMQNYLTEEVGVTIHHKPIVVEEQKKKLFIGHGDGLGSGDYFYKLLKQFFTSKVCQFLFARLHPNFSLSLAHTWSKSSRKSSEVPLLQKRKNCFLDIVRKCKKIILLIIMCSDTDTSL